MKRRDFNKFACLFPFFPKNLFGKEKLSFIDECLEVVNSNFSHIIISNGSKYMSFYCCKTGRKCEIVLDRELPNNIFIFDYKKLLNNKHKSARYRSIKLDYGNGNYIERIVP